MNIVSSDNILRVVLSNGMDYRVNVVDASLEYARLATAAYGDCVVCGTCV